MKANEDTPRLIEQGKRLVLLEMDVREVESVLREILSRGLPIRTTCDSEQQARHLLNKVEPWTPETDRAGRSKSNCFPQIS